MVIGAVYIFREDCESNPNFVLWVTLWNPRWGNWNTSLFPGKLEEVSLQMNVELTITDKLLTALVFPNKEAVLGYLGSLTVCLKHVVWKGI